jgi:hypothetical protein
MENCNLVLKCPSSCNFLFLCSLVVFCYWGIIFKPNPLYPKRWALNPTLKLLWSRSLVTLIVVTDHALLNLILFYFSTFLLAAFLDGVNVCSIHLDLFSFLFLIFSSLILSTISFSNGFFISTLLCIGLMWPHVN